MWIIYKLVFIYVKRNLSNGFIGAIKITFPNNRSLYLGNGSNIAKIHIKNTLYLFGLLFYGLPHLGAGYSKGYWQTDNLFTLLELGIKNKNLFNSLSVFNKILSIFSKLKNFFSLNTIEKSKKHISFHYDLGNKFYSLWLDRTMTYSSAIFNKNKILEKAQINKYDKIANLAQIEKKHSVLEIGCGWGGFIKYIQNNIGSKITGITLSKKQYSYINNFIKKPSNVQLIDYRNVNTKFDRIISIEMFEAVGKKNWNLFFKSLRKILNKNGIAALQIITIAEKNYCSYSNRKDFIQKYIFPGGMLPTKTILRNLAMRNGFYFVEARNFRKDYAKTLKIWKSNFLENWSNIEKLGFDKKFKRLWEYYLCYCEVGFLKGEIDVGQYLLKRKEN